METIRIYVRDYETHEPFGLLTAIVDGNKVGIGYSHCKKEMMWSDGEVVVYNADTFRKDMARTISDGRAVKNLRRGNTFTVSKKTTNEDISSSIVDFIGTTALGEFNKESGFDYALGKLSDFISHAVRRESQRTSVEV